MLDFGSHLETLRARKRQGHQIPALDREPALDLDLLWIWNLFSILHRTRGVGFSAEPVTQQAFLAECHLAGVDDWEDQRFAWTMILALENVVRTEAGGAHPNPRG